MYGYTSIFVDVYIYKYVYIYIMYMHIYREKQNTTQRVKRCNIYIYIYIYVYIYPIYVKRNNVQYIIEYICLLILFQLDIIFREAWLAYTYARHQVSRDSVSGLGGGVSRCGPQPTFRTNRALGRRGHKLYKSPRNTVQSPKQPIQSPDRQY